jgi:hypothetical protein
MRSIGTDALVAGGAAMLGTPGSRFAVSLAAESAVSSALQASVSANTAATLQATDAARRGVEPAPIPALPILRIRPASLCRPASSIRMRRSFACRERERARAGSNRVPRGAVNPLHLDDAGTAA